MNGINCGGCKGSLTKALEAVDGLEIISIATKADTGSHPNAGIEAYSRSYSRQELTPTRFPWRHLVSCAVVVKGVPVEVARAAIVELDAGRGKFTIEEGMAR